jgi:transposase
MHASRDRVGVPQEVGATHHWRAAASKQLGINWRTVGSIVERVMADRLDPSRLKDLSVIGVDELSFRRHHNYVTVVVDDVKKRVVWIGEGKGAETLGRFFAELGPERIRKLTHVTMDMSAAYIAAIDAHAPHVEKIFDRFHVQRLASDAVDQFATSKCARRTRSRRRKRSRTRGWALLKRGWNLEPRDEQKLADVQVTNRRIYRAYLLKEMLAHILD